MKKILVLCLIFCFSTPIFARSLIICPTDTTEIENQIANNWGKSGGAWYGSWAQVQMGTDLGTGGVRGPMDNSMPARQMQRPHLRYTSLLIQNDSDRGEIEVDCQYLIDHNPEVFDRNYPSLTSNDNVFWMKAFFSGSANQCRKVMNTTVSCY